ncbi:MAG: enoyl-CoA hydratase/isomerase family protein [Chloroflexota bacterium]|nr:enoyl-CoA hydratase/isomerase family protein [Chloroflexota bacterium]
MSGDARQLIQYREQNGVAYLTIDRPEARNALTFAMYRRVEELCGQASEDDHIRVLVLRGNAGHFAAGTDIAQFREFRTANQAVEYERQQDRVMAHIESVPKPTIAAIEGVAAGGGALMALSCDLRVMSSTARIGVPVARTLGNCLSIRNCQRIVWLVGPSRAKEMLFTARLLAAEEALALGLVNEVVEPERLIDRATELAETIASHAPLTLRVTKEEVRRIADHERIPEDAADDLVQQCYLSADFKEGVEAFLGKREPRWTGR